MADFNISYLGSKNLGADDMELFKDVFMPGVMAYRDTECVMDGKHQTKSLTHGKSTTFPLIGRTTTEHHTPGALIQGNKIPGSETTVNIDFPVTASVFVTEEDEAFSNIAYEGPYKKRLGAAMASTEDKYRIRQVALSARSANDLTSEVGGSVIKNCSRSTGEDIYKAIKAGKITLKQKDVNDEIYCLLNWTDWDILFDYLPLINSDYKGQGNIAEGTLVRVAGVNLLCSNNVEYGSNITGTHQGRYDVDLTDTLALMFTEEAIAQANLKAIDVRVVPQPERKGTLIFTDQMYGVGKHDPRCAVELSTVTV